MKKPSAIKIHIGRNAYRKPEAFFIFQVATPNTVLYIWGFTAKHAQESTLRQH